MFGNYANSDELKEQRKQNSYLLDKEAMDIVYPKENNNVINAFYKGIEKRIIQDMSKEDENLKQNPLFDDSYVRISKLTSNGCFREIYYDLTVDKTEMKQMTSSDVKIDKFSAQNQLRMMVGNLLHDFIQDLMGDSLSKVEERVYDDELKVTGKNDGIFTSDEAIFEVKTVGLSVFNEIVRNGVPKRHHVEQIHWYMKLFGLKKAYLFYFNRNIDLFFGSVDNFTAYDNMNQIKRWREHNLEETIKIFEIDFNEEIMQNTMDNLSDIRERVQIFKDFKSGKKDKNNKPIKEKPYPKTTSLYLCKNCKYSNICKGNK